MSFTKEELEAVGVVEIGLGFDGVPKWRIEGGMTAWCERATFAALWERSDATPAHCALLRLALAHPDRAALALGEGWTLDGIWIRWSHDGWGLRVWVMPSAVYGSSREAKGFYCPIPPEFDAALARARRIAAAWQRIQAKGGGR